MSRGLFSLSTSAGDAAGIARSERGQRRAAAGDAFIAGEENALVRVLAAAMEREALRYNPLVLCGPTGVGKSTVARALVERRRVKLGLENVIETTGADLARSLAHAIEVHATDDFRSRHQRCDVLAVDDCQSITNKPAAQQFLLTAIDALVRRGALVIVTMQQSPLATRKLPPALVSRLTSGLVVSLAHPGFEARCELVRRASQQLSLPLGDDEIEQLAGSPSKHAERFLTAGKLRAAVLKRAAKSSAKHDRTARDENSEMTSEADRPDEKLICRASCSVLARHFGLTAGEVRGKSRTKSIADARALAMYVARELTGASYAKIGRHFGGRDHTTVLHACKKLVVAIEKDPLLGRLAEDLARQATAAGGE